jgi:hypothetical protein
MVEINIWLELKEKNISRNYILSCDSVTIDRDWIGDGIY